MLAVWCISFWEYLGKPKKIIPSPYSLYLRGVDPEWIQVDPSLFKHTSKRRKRCGDEKLQLAPKHTEVAVVESCFGSLKHVWLLIVPLPTREDMRNDVMAQLNRARGLEQVLWAPKHYMKQFHIKYNPEAT